MRRWCWQQWDLAGSWGHARGTAGTGWLGRVLGIEAEAETEALRCICRRRTLKNAVGRGRMTKTKGHAAPVTEMSLHLLAPKRETSQMRRRGKKDTMCKADRDVCRFPAGISDAKDRGNGQRQGRTPLLISAVSLPYGVLPFSHSRFFFSSLSSLPSFSVVEPSEDPSPTGPMRQESPMGCPTQSPFSIPPSGPRGKPRPDGTLVPRDWSWLLFSFCFPCSLLEPLD